MDNAEQAHK